MAVAHRGRKLLTVVLLVIGSPMASTAALGQVVKPSASARERLLAEVASENPVLRAEMAEKILEQEGAAAIPFLIGVVDSDNSYKTVYGIGYFVLRKRTGIDFSPFHDGAWWRRWWDANRDRYPHEVRSLSVPDLKKTKRGLRYTPFPSDSDTLQGKLKLGPRMLAEEEQSNKNLNKDYWIGVQGLAIQIASHDDPHAIPYLIGLLEQSARGRYDVGYFGLRRLTGVEYSEDRNGAWWRNWWRQNKSRFPADVRSIEIPDYRSPLVFSWKPLTQEEKERAEKARQRAEMQEALADVADIPALDLTVEHNPKMRYFLIGPRKNAPQPRNGFKLVVVMPGGDGSDQFHPFVRRIYKYALTDAFLIAQPVAVRWTPSQQVVWPTKQDHVDGMKFSTEDFVESLIKDVNNRRPVDSRFVFTLSWSSSGPAAYAIALQQPTAVTGSYIAMSVFHPQQLPPIAQARGRTFLIDHSRDDGICKFSFAQEAVQALQGAGANVRLTTYEGGHGWRGQVYRRISEGVSWLVDRAASGK